MMLNPSAIVWKNGWRASLARALIITRRELRDSLRDWRIVTPILTLTIVLPSVLIAALRMGHDLLERLGPDALDTKILPFSILAIGFFPMSFSLVIALETFVGEKERNSLEALLSAPLTDRELFTGKFIAAAIPPVFTSSAGMFTFVILVILTGGTVPVSLPLLGVFWLLTIFQALVMVAGAVIVSSHTTSVRAANLLASFIIFPMSIVVQIEALILLIGQRVTMLYIWLALMIVLVILLRTGVKIFNREEIVAREGDVFNIKGIFRNFGSYFKRTPREALARQSSNLTKFTIWRLYRHDIPQILALNKASMLIVSLSLVAAIILGWWLSSWKEVQEIIGKTTALTAGGDNPVCSTNLASSVNVYSNFSLPVTWDGIFLNNLRSILIGGIGSLFSLGIAGLLLLMIAVGPFGLIGGVFAQLKLNPLPLLLGFTLPHGIIELPAAVFAMGAALQMGSAFLVPNPGFTVGGSLQLAIVNYLKLLALVVPMLLIAAIIEANVTPAIGCWLTGGKF
ncbi:MAG: stage II sporulation protein M [Chloroflexota bacterium]|nr:stage II sporulation protein M [Chloroflexota bacterium]